MPLLDRPDSVPGSVARRVLVVTRAYKRSFMPSWVATKPSLL
jgi:hypothetical protein